MMEILPTRVCTILILRKLEYREMFSSMKHNKAVKHLSTSCSRKLTVMKKPKTTGLRRHPQRRSHRKKFFKRVNHTRCLGLLITSELVS
uniref:Uncharacterized protein n=1 Tax=Timema shepardi TaxID=629360 RepID=A0A7R9AY52_TIMSH|nr:unnamed protein product [Timema shepardi]